MVADGVVVDGTESDLGKQRSTVRAFWQYHWASRSKGGSNMIVSKHLNIDKILSMLL